MTKNVVVGKIKKFEVEVMEDEIEYSWNTCPPEILMIVFQYLGATSLITCMTVNKKWRNIAETVCQKIGWEKIAEEGLYNSGAHLINTGLGWRDKVVNSCLWYFYNTLGCTVTKLHEYQVSSVIHRSYIYKGYVVIVDSTGVTYYNLRNYEMTKQKQIKCYHYEENDHVAMNLKCAELGTETILYLHSKSCAGTCELQLQTSRCAITITDSINRQALHLSQEVCYVMQSNGELYAYRWDGHDWIKTAEARYYGIPDNIYALYKYRKDLYGMSQSGGVWRVNSPLMQVKKICSLNLPQHMPEQLKVALFYYLCSIVYEYGDIEKDILEDLYRRISYNISCAKFYGGIIFLGDFDGKIKACKPTYLANSNVFDLHVHEVCNVLCFICNTEQDPAIMDMNVYEDYNSHHLLIHTRENICQVELEVKYFI